MEYHEFRGKNIEEAVFNACKTLNISKDGLNYEVISDSSSGFFKMFSSKKVIIKVKVDKNPKK